ncbi:hypothetical protein [Onishia taeanensis]|uniref:hypothetical protein n=1 Tax=Onishia taeanensis TaxID=284577 RepID=UPI001587792C|nr:hypothetical protein [Halomonas taeanensis]
MTEVKDGPIHQPARSQGCAFSFLQGQAFKQMPHQPISDYHPKHPLITQAT